MIYVRRKDFTELKDRIKVKIEGKHYLDIFIWNSYAALLQNTGHAQDDDVGATYISTPFLEDNETGERIFSPKYGEMHLVHNKFGGGVFAHELQHFLLFWIDDHRLTIMPDEGSPTGTWIAKDTDHERICELAGAITHRFWIEFFKRGLDVEEETAAAA